MNGKKLLVSLQLTNKEKEYALGCVTEITVGILAKTYASDGILHRGN